ncbi:MAG: glycerol-3-phosphate 1-O-acyltransferase PlsY [Desulfobacteraceae bacterium]|nr:glycerol-3-phosphate 1-O-acyltransferase PlsY [Desulfobacteraceae bacterium]
MQPILFILPLIAYLSGSIPFGWLTVKRLSSEDIRKTGSGNIGATNVLRTSGRLPAAITLAADVLKGVFPVWYAVWTSSSSLNWSPLLITLTALAAFCGHLFPVYTGFKGGGKGVATAAGCYLVISPLACLFALSAFVLLVYLTRRVSPGSLAAALVLPIGVWITTGAGLILAGASVTSLLIILRHRSNIMRLYDGREPIIGQ